MPTRHGRSGIGVLRLTGYGGALSGRAVINLLFPLLLARAVNAALTTPSSLNQPIQQLAACMLALAVLEIASALLGGYAISRYTAKLRISLVRHLLALGPADRLHAGDSVARVIYAASDAAAVPAVIVSTIIEMAGSITAAVAVWTIDWRTGLTFTALLPLVLLAGRRPLTALQDQQGRYLTAQSEISTRLLSALEGCRTIRSAGTAEQEVQRILSPLGALTTAGRGLWSVQRLLVYRVRVVIALIQVATLAAAGLSLHAGLIQPGDLLALVAYAGLALAGVDQIDTVAGLAHSAASRRRLSDAFALPTAPGGTKDLSGPPVAVTFHDVSLELADGGLHNITMHLPAEHSLAIVGASGSGKSLVAALVGGLVLPDRGAVLLNGVPVPELNPEILHRAVSYAFDTPALLGSTLAEAIAYPHPVDQQQVRRAARLAKADGFIRRLPAGYQTAVTAAPMSGGELQRVGLARAFAADAPVLVLDDAMTGLDAVTEAEIRDVITTRLPGRTRLLVAHNAATAAGCDLVAWLEDGHLRAVGCHTDLWPDPDYRALFVSNDLSESIA
jgi:ATP-binding cassette subfamily B protein